MKVLFVLLVSHLLVCGIVGYAFGKWSFGEGGELGVQSVDQSSQAEDETPAEPLMIDHGAAEQMFILESRERRITSYQYIFTVPQAMGFYGVAGLIGLLVALLAELYPRFFPAS
ncbi:MAG: hypothetical protein V4710_16440 [Verrucomicrobiota bacterium]